MVTIHPDFQLNGVSYTKIELLDWVQHHLASSEDYLKDTAEFLLQWLDATDSVVVQTSGTTGTPKKIGISKQAMIHSAQATGSFFGLAEHTRALCCLPVKYIAGKMMLVRALVLGWELDIVPPKSQPLAESESIYDFVAMVPLQVSQSLSDLNKVKTLLIGGASVDKDLVEKLLELSCNAYESYSMTETVTHIALKKIGEQCFNALPNVSLSLDERNCLVIDAPLLNSEQLITNDVVELLSPTSFIWKGRADNVVNSGGVKLFPEKIEAQLSNDIDRRFFLAGMPDEKLGECLVLIMEGEPYAIDAVIFSALEKYERPKKIYFVPNFEETETGKIKRKLILENFINKKL